MCRPTRIARSRAPAFICEIVAENPEFRHHIIYEDDAAIVFLNKYPTLYGYSLVAPRGHREQATCDFTVDELLRAARRSRAVERARGQRVD